MISWLTFGLGVDGLCVLIFACSLENLTLAKKVAVDNSSDGLACALGGFVDFPKMKREGG